MEMGAGCKLALFAWLMGKSSADKGLKPLVQTPNSTTSTQQPFAFAPLQPTLFGVKFPDIVPKAKLF